MTWLTVAKSVSPKNVVTFSHYLLSYIQFLFFKLKLPLSIRPTANRNDRLNFLSWSIGLKWEEWNFHIWIFFIVFLILWWYPIVFEDKRLGFANIAVIHKICYSNHQLQVLNKLPPAVYKYHITWHKIWCILGKNDYRGNYTHNRRVKYDSNKKNKTSYNDSRDIVTERWFLYKCAYRSSSWSER